MLRWEQSVHLYSDSDVMSSKYGMKDKSNLCVECRGGPRDWVSNGRGREEGGVLGAGCVRKCSTPVCREYYTSENHHSTIVC